MKNENVVKISVFVIEFLKWVGEVIVNMITNMISPIILEVIPLELELNQLL